MLNLVKIIAIKTEHKFQINLSIILVDFILKEKKKKRKRPCSDGIQRTISSSLIQQLIQEAAGNCERLWTSRNSLDSKYKSYPIYGLYLKQKHVRLLSLIFQLDIFPPKLILLQRRHKGVLKERYLFIFKVFIFYHRPIILIKNS